MDKVDVIKQFLVENEGYTDERAELEAKQLLNDKKYKVLTKDQLYKKCLKVFEKGSERGYLTDLFNYLDNFDVTPFIENIDWFVDRYLSDLKDWFDNENEEEG